MASALSHIVLYTIWLSAEAIELGRPYWIIRPVSCHIPEAVTTVFKCSWGWTHKASETCRVILQLLINILPSCIMLVLYIYYVLRENSTRNIMYCTTKYALVWKLYNALLAAESYHQGKRTFGRLKRRWEDNIKMDFQAVVCGVMDLIKLAHDRDRWRALVNGVTNLRVP